MLGGKRERANPTCELIRLPGNGDRIFPFPKVRMEGIEQSRLFRRWRRCTQSFVTCLCMLYIDIGHHRVSTGVLRVGMICFDRTKDVALKHPLLSASSFWVEDSLQIPTMCYSAPVELATEPPVFRSLDWGGENPMSSPHVYGVYILLAATASASVLTRWYAFCVH